MNKFIYRMLCKNYESTATALAKEMRTIKLYSSATKTPLTLEFEEALKMLRLFLDNSGIPMSRPKWVYDEQDQSTWLYTPQKSLNKSFHMLQSRRL